MRFTNSLPPLGSAVLLVIVATFTTVIPTYARLPEQVLLEILPKEPVPLGENAQIGAQLKSETGTPFEGQLLDLYLNGILKQSLMTDSSGTVIFRVEDFRQAGSYLVKVVYAGVYSRQPIETEFELLVLPAQLTVQILPPLAGIPFALDDQSFRSGPDGIARLLINQVGSYSLKLQPFENQSPDFRAEFKSWEPVALSGEQPVIIPGNLNFQIGFEISRPVRFSYFDSDGNPIASARVASVYIESSDGNRYTFESGGQTHWLRANRILQRLEGLDSLTVRHSVQNVTVDGSNVVYRGQQRFITPASGEQKLNLLLYSIQFTRRDPLFRFSLGNGLKLEFPDGTTKVFPFRRESTLTLDGLARGQYQVRGEGIPGIAFTIPIIISRNQVINLPMLSYFDILAILLTLIGLGGGLLLFGRRDQITKLFFQATSPKRRNFSD